MVLKKKTAGNLNVSKEDQKKLEKKELKEEGKQIAKARRVRVPAPISEDSEKCSTNYQNKNGEVSEFANFIARIACIISDEDSNKSIHLKIRSFEKNYTLELDSKSWTSPGLFREAVAGKDPFLIYSANSQAQHSLFQRFVSEKSLEETPNIPEVKKTQHMGLIDDGFLFHNALVKRDGTIKNLDGLIIPPKPQNGRKMTLYLGKEESEREEILRAYASNLITLTGSQAWKILGFAAATLFLDQIIDRTNTPQFPVAFFYGTHQTGKSTIARSIQACLGCHVAIPEASFGTQKAWQRVGSKFKNCLVLLNEFKSTEASNTLLCQLHDREGYSIAKKDMTVDTKSIDVNSAYAVISTQNVTGGKAEDVHSRFVEIESDKFNVDPVAFKNLRNSFSQLSCFVPYCLKKIGIDGLIDEIEHVKEELQNQLLGKKYEDRILHNHAVILASYNLFVRLLGISEQSVEEASKQVIQQSETTKKADLGQTFLNTLYAMVENDKINRNVAKVEKEAGKPDKLVFSLSKTLPFVRQQGKWSDTAIADEKTVARALAALGCSKIRTRSTFEAQTNVWVWEIPETLSPEKLDVNQPPFPPDSK